MISERIIQILPFRSTYLSPGGSIRYKPIKCFFLMHKGLSAGRHPTKPPGAWTPDQCVDQLVKSLNAGDFYILCEDNDVKRWQDEKRMQWNVDDVIKNKSALSRWDEKYKGDYEAFMKQ